MVATPCIRASITLIMPFQEPLQGRVQEHYNCHHAYRWYDENQLEVPLFQGLEMHHTFVPGVVIAYIILHNISLSPGDVLEPEDKDDVVEVPSLRPVRDKEQVKE
ncbi:hypothetical protein AAFF_G00194470, partial [Aldrovandia affinis]